MKKIKDRLDRLEYELTGNTGIDSIITLVLDRTVKVELKLGTDRKHRYNHRHIYIAGQQPKLSFTRALFGRIKLLDGGMTEAEYARRKPLVVSYDEAKKRLMNCIDRNSLVYVPAN